MEKDDLILRTNDLCQQLKRYGCAVFNEDIAQLLELLCDINDDFQNDVSIEMKKYSINRMIVRLINFKEKLEKFDE
jgi:hypothetical protein